MKYRDVLKRPRRQDRLIHERIHDPYKARLKLHEPTLCPQCGAVYHQGRWRWAETPPSGAQEELCQACCRINDNYPAGELTLSGRFLTSHRDEVMNLIHNVQKAEADEHPLNRIIAIEEKPGEALVTTTDIHLPHRIAHALFEAYEGVFEVHYDEEGYFARASWRRDD